MLLYRILKLAKIITYDSLNPKFLLRNIQYLLENRDSYRNNIKKLSELSKKLNGPEKISDIAINYSSRMLVKY